MGRKNGRTPPRPWQPMQRAVAVPRSPEAEAYVAAAGLGDRDLELWKNDRYTVNVERDGDGNVRSLSIKRNDKKAARDWRHFQMIKNDIAGEEAEAIELYPAQKRVVDTANQYWLWVLPPGIELTTGFEFGRLSDHDDPVHETLGSVQRELPPEWKPEKEETE